MSHQNPNFIANGNISPSRFVKIDTSDNESVLQAGSNEDIIGISTDAGREAPLPSVSTMYAGQAGDIMHVYGMGSCCLLELGGTVTAGDELIADSNGKGTTRATSGTTLQKVGAIALESGVSGDKIKVQVWRQVVRPT